MNTQPDFEELLRLLEEQKIEYMIVGGYAVAFHGHPRFTKDIDIFVDTSRANLENLCKALVAFGFSRESVSPELFEKKGNIVTFGVPPVRVDILNEIDGLSYEEAKPGKVRGEYGDVEVPFIGLADLLRNKKASRRTKDKADLEELEGE